MGIAPPGGPSPAQTCPCGTLAPRTRRRRCVPRQYPCSCRTPCQPPCPPWTGTLDHGGARVGVAHHGVGGDGPGHPLHVGKVPSSVLLLLELSETCSRVELAILVARAVPLGVGEVPRGLADGADKGPEYRASHWAGDVLQLLAPELGLSFSIRVAELADVVETHRRDCDGFSEISLDTLSVS